MSEIMTPIPFDKLISWMMKEYKSHGSIFGISKDKFYKNISGKKINILRTKISSPIGPAAGPNTQLAQNLLSAYVAGARVFELKTVQTIDGEDLRKCIARPCINAEDEGYNCEWSTELTVQQAYEEYVKGWFALHVAAYELKLSDECDFIFNMSVGYDYEGITSKKIDDFICSLVNAEDTEIFKQCKQYLLDNIDEFENITPQKIEKISPEISSSITLSTLHGCPPEEIEKIAYYFLTEKKLHTYIKCNPTLLGYELTREILDKAGYRYISFDNRHFEQDLKFDDAVKLVERLKDTANQNNLTFGVKITNTFPVQIKDDELPGEFMYMSGRALYLLSINVAEKFAKYFNGDINISYSGGADYFTLEGLLESGIKPITFCTTILKPGGYARIKQLSLLAEKARYKSNKIDIDALSHLTEKALINKHILKEARDVKSRKTESVLPLYDCYKAPCKEGGCPINQQIPEYLELVAKGEYERAFSVIAIDNALPSVLSILCSHACQSKCTRLDYEMPLQIRNAKNIAVRNAQQKYIDNIKKIPLKTDKKVAVIGAGPAGIAAGTYLRRNGVSVTVFEKNDSPMGIVKYIIPGFRVSEDDMNLDYNMSVKTGVDYKFNVDAEYNIDELKREFDYVIIATGAWKHGFSPVKQGGENLTDALDFLDESKKAECRINLGENIAVIGGGDVAMDCARAAKRAEGAKKVDIVYRRTKEYMPAEPEEIRHALSDGINMIELYSPVSYDGKTLKAEKMRLSEKGEDGRKKVVSTEEEIMLEYDTVISATGARVNTELFEKNNIELDGRYPKLDENNESSIKNVYIAGDCSKGASSIVSAVADSKIIAKNILNKLDLENDFIKVEPIITKKDIRLKKAILRDGSQKKEDGERCLSCDRICEICVTVCPNRANVVIMADERPQIIHIDGMCNECGNCGTFCPHTGNPYKDKITLFWDVDGFRNSTNKGMLILDDDTILIRDEEDAEYKCRIDDKRISDNLRSIINAVKSDYTYLRI